MNGSVDGQTVMVIEHNLDVISIVDWIIDMGLGRGQQTCFRAEIGRLFMRSNLSRKGI